jgi:Kef-type K+ transport system membrane component KefB
MFLLFRVGLEVKASELFQVGGTAMLVAVLGVALPFVLGWGLMQAWGEPSIEAVFVGAAMVATSVGITAQVLASRGLIRHRASQIILAAAVIDDILGLLVFAVVSSLAKGQINVLEIVLTGVVALAFTALVARWGVQTMSRIVPKLEANLHAGEVQFNLALILLFALALLAVYARVAPIIGAFLAGMVLAESMGHRVHDLTNGVAELLVPFFLVGIGLHLDLSVFGEARTVEMALAILVAAVVSKLAGCGLGAYSLGRADMLRVGVGMVPRGEVGMVVAQLGLAMGVIRKPIYGVVVFMAVASTMIAPPLLKWAYRGARAEAPERDFEIG